MKQSLLIVDDDDEIRTQMRWALAEDYEILQAQDRTSALKVFRSEKPLVVLLDLGLPPHSGTPEEGLAALAEILEEDPRAKVIVITGQDDKAIALQAIGAGAYDFMGKPVDVDILVPTLKRAFHVASLEREFSKIRKSQPTDQFEGMLGSSPKMDSVFSSIRKVATADAPVLILGESGTGKEMVARAIHARSRRSDGPFVALNCSAIPETLLESELFGHEKGSFTGAHAQRLGRIEHASGGTLFLDEIGEISAPIQVKLLRFLQEQRIERVGGREEIVVEARVVAATNIDLTKAMANGSFREDLYYRLGVVEIKLPALRDRGDDTQLLARYFLQQYAEQNGKTGVTFGKSALTAISRHEWPGNVRELQNKVRRAVIMADRKQLSPEDLELGDGSGRARSTNLKEAREALEREMITDALKRNEGKITQAAEQLGISRPTLYDLMGKLGIERGG
ncbi:MAG: PEP-CTERM-box response regulator transcription factor [Opitutaceae bacterium]